MTSPTFWATLIAALTGAAALAIAGPDGKALENAAAEIGGPLAERAAVEAAQAAKNAWALQAQVKKVAMKNLEFVPLVQAEIAMAKAAMETAKEKDEQATILYEETKESTYKAAMKAAEEYLVQVRAAAADATALSGVNRHAEEKAAEEAAGRSASRAAMPYNGNLLRLQRVVVAYEQRARAMAAASNHLKGEGATLASSAQQYQAAGQTVQAAQIMVQAHSLFDQGQRLQQQAEKLHGTAQEIYSGLPVYQQAEQAAADSAAAEANPPAFPPAFPQPY